MALPAPIRLAKEAVLQLFLQSGPLSTDRLSAKHMKRVSLLCLAAWLVSLSSSSAAILIGNVPASNDSALTPLTSQRTVAVSFTLPAQDYTVQSVTLRLGNYLYPGREPNVGIYTDVAGLPGTLVGSLFTPPPSASGDIADFVFTAGSTLTLTAGTTYWLAAWNPIDTGIDWIASNSDTPHSRTPIGVATFGEYRYFLGGLGGGTSIAHDLQNTFSIEAIAVPEPAHFALAAGFAGLLFALRRRR
jgi:hypothetical protein